MNDTASPRKVTWLLGTGIAFLPYIFSWFTLKEGYSKKVKITSFVWMIVVFALIGSNNQKSHQDLKKQQHENISQDRASRQENPSTQRSPKSNRSGNEKLTVAQLKQLDDACLKAGLYSLAYMELKSTGQDSHTIYSSMDSWLEEYPVNIRPAVKAMWLKTFSMVDNSRDPRVHGSHTQQEDASIDLAAACRITVKRLAN